MTLRQAIEQGNLEKVKGLLVEEPSLIDDTTDGIWLPFYAAQMGNEPIVKYIVEYSRASFNENDENNRSMLHYAVESGNLSLVKYIVERLGMAIDEGDINLVTPYDIAVEKGFSDICDYFAEKCGAKLEDMYRNPIRTGMNPDPSIICVGDDFYMVNSSFVFFPCIPISHSKDLIHWKVIGHAITNPSWAMLDDIEGGRGYWAPDISYYNGKFYITATYRLNDTGTVYRKQIVVSSSKPEGPYCEPAIIDEDGIDPSIFTDDDGKRYMLLNRGARIFEISEDGKKQLSEATLLYYGNQKRAPEGSHLLKKDGYYYLFQAEGGTGIGHRISVSRSKELFGVYEPCPYNPIMIQKNPKAAIQRCGHGKPVKTPNGEWYMVYLCGRKVENEYSILGRETALDPITWTADGWPLVNNLKGPSVIQKKPDLLEYIQDDVCDDFENGILSNDWFFARPPHDDVCSFENGMLKLKGSVEDITSMKARNFILQRQTKFKFSFSVEMEIPNMISGQFAGLTCYYDENTLLTFGVEKDNIVVFEHIDEKDNIAYKSDAFNLKAGTVIGLKIETDYLKRSFYVKEEGSDSWKLVATLENVYYLCDEAIKKGKRFTGATFGLYVLSGKNNNELYAKFKNVTIA